MPYKDKDLQRRRQREIAYGYSEFIKQYKSRPCTDCGIEYPWYVMQFDHVRGLKSFNISTRKFSISNRRFLEEAEKCDVVCANCHAERTYTRLVLQ